MQRIVVVLGLLGALFSFDGESFGQEPCKTPPSITAGVSPNVLLVFDTSGSMWNVVWDKNFDPFIQHHEFDRDGNPSRLLPVEEDQVVFGEQDQSCQPSSHTVLRNSSTGKVRLRFYKVRPGSTDVCDSSSATVKSDSSGYFYFDRLEKRFIDAGGYDSVDPNHVKVFLPYPAYSETSHPMSQETWYNYQYLNWIFYRSTEEERRSVIREAGFGSLIGEEDDSFKRSRLSRILVTKEAIKDVVQGVSGIRFGVMRFHQSSGGELIAPVGSTVDEIVSAVDEQWAGGWTPLAETMEDVWDYFSGQDSPIQDWCQNNFVILVTDGLPTKDSDDLSSGMKRNWDLDGGGTLDDSEENVYPSEGSDYMDDIAFYMYEHDARPDLQHGEEKRNIITYTIGFSTANRLLVDTAFNGNGFHGHEAEEWLDPESPLYRKYFYIAGDQKELREAISAAMREISLVASSGTGATLVSTGMSTDDLVFRASFHPVGWRGFLEAFEIKEDQGFELGEVKWEAGEFLRGMDLEDRRVWTALKSLTGADTKIRFIADNVTTKDVDNEQLFKLLDATNARDGEDIINFIRGADVPGYRERDGYRLGDIIHSTPVVVGPPNGYYHDPSYLEFRREHRSRERILYVGANDGMLHAFYVDGPDGGKEAWGFIPNNLLGRLKHLMDRDYESCHEYFVDLTPTVVDVFVDPDGLGPETQQWRTLLIGGEREGGEAYFALDVTEPDSDQFRPLWEFSDSRLGGSWSMPAVEKIDFGERGKWLAFVGNGFNNETGEGYLFAIDLETGENFRDPIPLESESPNVLANPRAVDIDGDDYVDSLFAGDLSGSVWRFDISDQTGSPKTYEPLDPAEWEAQEIFRALPGQGITQQVGLSFSCSGPTDQTCHNLVIYFGTGKFLTIEDKTDTSLQSFYAIKDQFSDDIITRDQMRSRTTSADCEQVPDPHQIKGWYVDLDAPGERLSSPPLVVGGLVFFLTFVPDEDACSAGGTTWLYYREFDTGCVPKETVSGEDPAPEGEEEERPVGKILVGPGYASPIVYYAKTQDMMIQTSDRTIHRRRVILPQKGIENYAWREVFY